MVGGICWILFLGLIASVNSHQKAVYRAQPLQFHVSYTSRRRVPCQAAENTRAEVITLEPAASRNTSQNGTAIIQTQAMPVAPPQAPAASPTHVGIKVKPALIAIALGLALRFIVPIPEGIAAQAWSLLSIFVSTILGLLLDPLPVGAWAFIAVTVAVATKTLTFAQAFAATTNEIIWLIVVSFFFAKASRQSWLRCLWRTPSTSSAPSPLRLGSGGRVLWFRLHAPQRSVRDGRNLRLPGFGHLGAGGDAGLEGAGLVVRGTTSYCSASCSTTRQQ
ncbi:hypothetical protein Vretimale_6562 [Volvox reticuliferus]|uniref:Uncharacterized protein n=1 Tax=Volvox reticuliferus TaxID=1737510 RepID=A0A8J4CAG1_9CHLO|nr:hypothetical protein Vretifemale_7375 [Volvox reticuliferus]GIM01780.1 hypothetical protein Vretimale_6562 [Volvox reticuliferus]